MKHIKEYLIAAAALPAVAFCFGFGITRLATIPSYGVIFVDVGTSTYLAPSCIEEWRKRENKTEILVRATAGEASQEGYKMDDRCREAGAFHADGRSLSGLLLEKIGLLGPIEHWWDQPYQTEEGVVYPPATEPRK